MKSAQKKTKQSAGLLLYRRTDGDTEVFLVHPGGPFWQKKDDGAWSIPKGEFTGEEDPLEAAKREFQEETGQPIDPKSSSGSAPGTAQVPQSEFRALRPVRQPSGKIVYAWAVEADLDPHTVVSNTFSLEWPPRSGKTTKFPEIDRAEWFPFVLARCKILKGQLPLLDQLVAFLASAHPPI